MALSYLFDDSDNFDLPKNQTERLELLKRVEFYAVLESGSLGLLSGLLIVLVTAMIEPFEGRLLDDIWWDRVLNLGLVLLFGQMMMIWRILLMS